MRIPTPAASEASASDNSLVSVMQLASISSGDVSSPASKYMSGKAKLFWLITTLLQITLFTYIARHRFLDTDEGFYLLAARLVLMHKKPYVDFFFQQAPLLPYMYALWLKCFHLTWEWARTLPALLTAALGLLLYKHVWDETRSC